MGGISQLSLGYKGALDPPSPSELQGRLCVVDSVGHTGSGQRVKRRTLVVFTHRAPSSQQDGPLVPMLAPAFGWN